MGWFGPIESLLHTLDVVGADRDPEGNFDVAGELVVGLGGREIVVGDSARYFKNGEPFGLASLLNSTSYGVRNITVIGRDTTPAGKEV